MTAPGDQSLLRDINDRAALTLLLEHGELTRHRLCELTGLSRPTASRIMTRLESLDLVYVAGVASARRGPNAASYAVRSDRVLGVAMNVDRTSVQATVVDLAGADHPVVEAALSRSAGDRGPVGVVTEAVRAACAAAGLDETAVRMVCLGVPGAVDRRTDELNCVAGLPGWPRKGIHAVLRAALGCEVTIENDVHLAAIAERNLGSGRGAQSFALLWLGDGLGSAVDIDGTVLRGASGRAGEIDALTVPRWAVGLDPEAHDLQSLVGASALARVARERDVTKRGFTALMSALESHPRRDEIFAVMAPRVAAAVAAVLAVVDPDRVVLGGPMATCGGPALERHVQAAIRRHTRWSPTIVTTSVVDHPVLTGARESLATAVRTNFLDEFNVEPSDSESPVPGRVLS